MSGPSLIRDVCLASTCRIFHIVSVLIIIFVRKGSGSRCPRIRMRIPSQAVPSISLAAQLVCLSTGPCHRGSFWIMYVCISCVQVFISTISYPYILCILASRQAGLHIVDGGGIDAVSRQGINPLMSMAGTPPHSCYSAPLLPSRSPPVIRHRPATGDEARTNALRRNAPDLFIPDVRQLRPPHAPSGIEAVVRGPVVPGDRLWAARGIRRPRLRRSTAGVPYKP